MQAERMCAALLHLEGYQDINPQHPFGGPDGLKDVLCKKGGKTWVAAAYFPPTAPTFKEIKAKFVHDAAGIEATDALRTMKIGGSLCGPGELPHAFQGLRVIRYEEPVAKPDFAPRPVRVVRFAAEKPTE